MILEAPALWATGPAPGDPHGNEKGDGLGRPLRMRD